MAHRTKGFVMKALVGLLLLSTVTHAEVPNHTGELLYQIKSSALKSNQSDYIRVHRPRVNSDLEEIKQKMMDSGRFTFVDYNTIETHDVDLEFEENNISKNFDPEFKKQWQHEKVETLRAWDISRGSEGVLVGVCDSGVERLHEDLKGRVLKRGYDFVDLDTDANPVTSHGTFVAGLIAATASNTLGGAGVAPNVKILPLRITDSKGSTTMKTITDCIRFAADAGAKVINVSFTGIQNQSVEAVGRYARSKGALLIYSAGNQGRNRSKWPDFEHVVAVGATNINDQRWTYRRSFFRSGGSNYGPFIDIVAPGHNVVSTTTYVTHNQGSDPYRSGSGTSYSAPIVAGIAALIYSINPNLSPVEVEQILKESSDQIGDQYTFGAGRANAYNAVQMAIQTL